MKAFNAVTHPLSGVHLIEASAGTGKTYNMTLLVLRLVLEQGIPIEKILVVTFTEAATEELREKTVNRLSDVLTFIQKGMKGVPSGDAVLYRRLLEKLDVSLAKERLRAALMQFDRAQIFTIHGFCQRMLFENAFETGMEFGLELVTDNTEFFATLAKDFWIAFCAQQSPLLIALLHNHQVNVANLAQLAKTVYSKPDLKLVVRMVRDDAEAEYMAAYHNARRLFEACADRLEGVFRLAKGINRRRYSKSSVPRWMNATRLAFAEETPYVVIGEKDDVARFAWSALTEDATDDFSIDDAEFFKAVDMLLQAGAYLERKVEDLHRIFVTYVAEIMPRRKAQQGVVFFDDLLLDLRRALESDKRERLQQIAALRYSAALIDEFQDTDATQYHIFDELFVQQKIPFFMIGDPKQAIYGFRGGDIFAYMRAAKSVQDNTWSLGTNWRSSKDLVVAVNQLFSAVRNPFLYAEIGFHPVAAHPGSESIFSCNGQPASGFQFLFCQRTDDNCGKNKNGEWKQLSSGDELHIQRTCGDMVQLLSGACHLGDTAIEPQDVAVLVRSNKQARTMRDALARYGIPASVSQTESVMETVAADEFYQILEAVNTHDVSLIKAALSTVAFGVKGEALLHLVSDTERLDKWQTEFIRLRRMYEGYGIVAFTEALLQLEVVSGDGGLKARVLNQGEMPYLDDMMQLVSLFREQFFARRVPFEQLLHQMTLWLQQLPAEKGFARYSEDDAGVQIVTIHKSKGLQYKVVYLPFLSLDGGSRKKEMLLYHDESDGNVEVCDLRMQRDDDTAAQQKAKEDRAENMRLLYVALTRAEQVCKVVFGGFKGMEKTPLSRLLLGADEDIIYRMDDAALMEKLALFCEKSGAVVLEDGYDAIDNVADGTSVLATMRAKIPLPPFVKEGTTISPFEKGGRGDFGGIFDTFEPLQFHPFNYTAAPTPQRASFSSLVHGASLIDSTKEDEWSLERTDARDNTFVENEIVNASASSVFSDFETGFLGMNPVFGRGPVFGNLVHDILERRMTLADETAPLKNTVREMLVKYGFADEMPLADTTRWIADILKTPLIHNGVCTLETLNGVCVPEMEFVMPVARGATFSNVRLSAAMGINAKGAFADYVQTVRELPFSPLFGHLKGFIDLVFEHDGRYFIADYKTNDLGTQKENYAPDALQTDMAHHHYFLQYHLYTLALHRYLRHHLTSYAYETHFGGVLYLYVRGISSITGPQYGIWYDCPPLTRVAALDALLQDLEGGTE
ncbi:MAG: UvrD-helicase domain-containing protein [Deltaproteobacteria bacterium]|nr:UvrD-helicase domain-containing protein [Deltaproteobacteria bacterium]